MTTKFAELSKIADSIGERKLANLLGGEIDAISIIDLSSEIEKSKNKYLAELFKISPKMGALDEHIQGLSKIRRKLINEWMKLEGRIRNSSESESEYDIDNLKSAASDIYEQIRKIDDENAKQMFEFEKLYFAIVRDKNFQKTELWFYIRNINKIAGSIQFDLLKLQRQLLSSKFAPNGKPSYTFSYNQDEFILTLTIARKKYSYYNISPFKFNRFRTMLRKNFGKAIQYLIGTQS